METSIALLRGINVGGHRSVPMAVLRELLLGLGLTKVLTYIQSGNAVFTGAGTPQSLEARIEDAIARRFGFEVEVIVRTARQWSRYVTSNPFPNESLAQPNFVTLMLSKVPITDAAVTTMRSRATGGERIERIDDALWFYFDQGAGRSKLAAVANGAGSTARNWRTVLKLAEMAGL